MKIHINLHELFPKSDNQKKSAWSKLADFILAGCVGLGVAVMGVGVIELAPGLAVMSDFLRALAYLLVVWCTVAAVILAYRLKRWVPALLYVAVALSIVYLYLFLAK